jgi:hypothetical protein
VRDRPEPSGLPILGKALCFITEKVIVLTSPNLFRKFIAIAMKVYRHSFARSTQFHETVWRKSLSTKDTARINPNRTGQSARRP